MARRQKNLQSSEDADMSLDQEESKISEKFQFSMANLKGSHLARNIASQINKVFNKQHVVL